VKYKILLAVLSGAGFSSLLVLLLNAPVPVLPKLLTALLLPAQYLSLFFRKLRSLTHRLHSLLRMFSYIQALPMSWFPWRGERPQSRQCALRQ